MQRSSDLIGVRRHLQWPSTAVKRRTEGGQQVDPSSLSMVLSQGSDESSCRVIKLARKSSSHPAVFRLSLKETLPGASRIRFCAMCLMVQKLAGA